MHNGNLIPVAGRYLLVAAWYGGGTSVIDFTDPTNPHEIALLRRAGEPAAGDAWSSYWYNGKIYTNDISRGQDVFDFVLPAQRVRRHLHAPERADAGRAAALALRDAGPVTGVQRTAAP